MRSNFETTSNVGTMFRSWRFENDESCWGRRFVRRCCPLLVGLLVRFMGMQSREAAHEVIDNAMRELLEILSGGGDVVDENAGGRQEVAQHDLRGRARAFDLESDFTGDEVMRARRE